MTRSSSSVPVPLTRESSSTTRVIRASSFTPQVSKEAARLDNLLRRLRLPQVQNQFLPEGEKLGSDYEITRIKQGRSNYTYELKMQKASYAVRVSGENYEAVVDVEAEEGILELASQLEVCPKVLYYDSHSRLLISKFLPGRAAMTPESLKDTEKVKEVLGLLKKLHQADAGELKEALDIFTINENYFELIEEKEMSELAYPEFSKKLEEIEGMIMKAPISKAPCHNDLQPTNILFSNNRLYLIDFERGGLGDPVFDLAKLSMESCFSPEQESFMLKTYYGDTPDSEIQHRLQLYKAAIYFNVALWCRMKLSTDRSLLEEDVEDYTNYERVQLGKLKNFLVSNVFLNAMKYYSLENPLSQHDFCWERGRGEGLNTALTK